MPMIIAILGYIVGGGLMALGIIGLFRKRKNEEQIDAIIQELENKTIAMVPMLKVFEALRDNFALGLKYPQMDAVLRDKLPGLVGWGLFSSDILATFTQLELIHSTSIDPEHSVWLDFKRESPNYVYHLTDKGTLLAHKLMSRKLKTRKGGSQP